MAELGNGERGVVVKAGAGRAGPPLQMGGSGHGGPERQHPELSSVLLGPLARRFPQAISTAAVEHDLVKGL